MELTEKEILSQLRLRKVKLTLELQRIELAIKAFEDVDINSLNEFDIMAVDADLHSEFPHDSDTEPKVLMYHEKMGYEDKILWTLGRLKTATASEITGYLMRYDSKPRNKTKFNQSITFTASRMYRLGKINAERRSRVNIYSLKPII